MLMNPPSTLCSDPDRLADKLWTAVNSMDFACKPSVEVEQPVVSQSGSNLRIIFGILSLIKSHINFVELFQINVMFSRRERRFPGVVYS